VGDDIFVTNPAILREGMAKRVANSCGRTYKIFCHGDPWVGGC